MNPSIAPANPQLNITVHASAGTGKTWLLVTRIVRMLLAGVSPDEIVAVTFTRKAAAEMQARVNLCLHELAKSDDAELDHQLIEMGLEPNPLLRKQARYLYEQLLFSEHPLRTTTFHSFCLDLLQRFPLEAAVPPGFDLLESSGSMEQEALDALFAEATENSGGPIAQALEQLFDGCNGLANTGQALRSFLSHRSDWWAYSSETDTLGHATKALTDRLGIDPARNPVTDFFDDRRRNQCREFAEHLHEHPTKTNEIHAQSITLALSIDHSPDECLQLLKPAFLTNAGDPRARKAGKTQAAKMGEEGQARFLTLHTEICADLIELADQLAKQNTWRLSQAWFAAGSCLLEHYQRLKWELRLLDFTDLEWQAYRLLTASGNAQWVQYKLDARINHLLIDEFQDTNPTQWRLILPLLEELAAGDPERARSVFIVGDTKQSIYRFRRANPKLMETASSWMQQHLDAQSHTLDASWRSAPAIIQFVNQVFSAEDPKPLITDFPPHDTHKKELWGQVEVMPLIESEPDPELDPKLDSALASDVQAGIPMLRDPLKRPRQIKENRTHQLEGRCIAERIQALIDNKTLLGATDEARPIQYGDILILLRSRTHADAYEQALRDAGIPYLGAGRGALLDSLEVRDMEALLKVLVTPYNNLDLAQVLRSPIFSISNEDLVSLAQLDTKSWMEALEQLADSIPEQSPLSRACRLLENWKQLAGKLPVHDLLDRIYYQGDILARYRCAFPKPLQARVTANLTRFIELALDVDSGRYPSLPHFLNRLKGLRNTEQDAPDEAPTTSDTGSRVRIMTIHGAKGLESPVVFIADTAASNRSNRAYQALIDWPAEAAGPSYFLLAGRKIGMDSVSAALIREQEKAEAREEANLLYVALTRAKQMLIISGASSASSSGASNNAWYSMLSEQMTAADGRNINGTLILESGIAPKTSVTTPALATPTTTPDPRLCKPVILPPIKRDIAPSHVVDLSESGGSERLEARQRGIAIHRMLELLCTFQGSNPESLLPQLARESNRNNNDPELMGWWKEANKNWLEPRFAHLFGREQAMCAYSEVPIQYFINDALVYGIIDRIVVQENEIQMIDYKTHAHADTENAQVLAQEYAEQLQLYATGVRKIWPHKVVHAGILFTACSELVMLF